MNEILPSTSSVRKYNPDGMMICIWGEKDIIAARKTLRIKYDDAPCTPEVIQAMIDELTRNHRYDPEQIEKAITQHFKKRKG